MPKTSPYPTATAFLPAKHNLKSLREASKNCEGCPLFENATQTVFGEGPAQSRLMLVGETPGDAEDKQGRPFVGPAGKLLDKLLAEAGIDRRDAYVTNAVKHLKWTPRGTRRLHAKPSSREIFACRPWLEKELEEIGPDLLVLMGATAAQTLLGSSFKITKQRGKPFASDWAEWTMVTYHPSALLRAMDLPDGEQMIENFRDDLRLVAEKLRELK